MKELEFPGKIVHYVLGDGSKNPGTSVAAIITHVWYSGMCNLIVFPDGVNDFPPEHEGHKGFFHAFSVPFDEGEAKHTYHFIRNIKRSWDVK
jgi:hypothetical protein